MLLAFLACGAFFPAKAQEAAQGTVYYVFPLHNMSGQSNFISTTFYGWESTCSASTTTGTVGTTTDANITTFTALKDNAAYGGWLADGYNISPILTGDYDLLFEFKTNATATYKVKLVEDGNEAHGNETAFTANADGQWQTIRMNLKEKFSNFATSGVTTQKAYVFAFVTNDCHNGDTFDFANVRYVPKGTTDEPVVTTPSLAIAEASCAYKSATSVTASMKLNVTNFTGNVILAVLTKNTMQGITSFWNQPGDKTYQVLAQTTVSAADAAAGVTFDVEGLPESASTPILFAARTVAPGGTPVYAPTVDGMANTTQTEPGMVNTVYSESYNVAPYTNGISYTAANFNEDGSVKWTFPSWAKEYTEDGETVTAKNGISGRWVKIEKSAVENAEFYAPKITYTLSNDVDGYMYFSMTIHSDNIPAGLKPEFWVNNNRNQEDVNMTVVEGTNNKQWTWKSHYQYPNNHIISYQLYLSSSVGNAVTRVFGYEVRGATNGRVKQPANVELEKIAENAEIYQGKNISAQIYFLQAYDAYSAPQDDFKDKPIPMGTWSYTRCPSDFSNLNTEAFHFSPEIIYFVSNAVEDNEEDKKSKLYFSFQLGKSYGIVDGEERELSTIIPNDYMPQLIVYVPKENTTATTNAGLRANETVWVENEVTNMSQVRNYLNTYEVTSAKEYAANSNIKVGIKHTFTSIMGGKGYSVMEPRGYKMSSNDEVITGIEEVASEAEAVPAVATVYNLQGMAVRVNVATENALEGLPAGIYIVNGKKYAVR